MKFLYARVSSNDGSQKIDRQTTEIEKYDEVFEVFLQMMVRKKSIDKQLKLKNMMKYLKIMLQVVLQIAQGYKKC